MTGSGTGLAAYGVDVGGTKILGVAIGSSGEVLAERRVPTPSQAATAAAAAADHAPGAPSEPDAAEHPGRAVADAVVAMLVELHHDVRTGDPRAGGIAVPVGIGIAGLVDAEGVLRFSPNLAAASGVAIGDLVSERIAEVLPVTGVHAYNDANCTGFAELVLGAARGTRDGLVVTLGTGIGGALILDGRVYVGARGLAGEVGHMVIDPNGPPCTCGNRGCWERYASGGGLARLAREAALAGTLHESVRLAGGDPELVTGEHVTAAAAAGDAEALRVMGELGWWVGLGLANLVAIFDPEQIVVGGGLGHAGEMLLEPTRQALARLVVGGRAREAVPVVEAALGVQNGAIGAALAALSERAGAPAAG
ncbi:MAG: ROK family protein [Actinomycetota bacterium]|nr:ROK family protein [Actinomycetota bacterium]